MNLILSKADSYIFKLLKILLAACLATPFLASASFIFPYTAPKVFVFRVLVEIAVILYFYLALKYPDRFLFSIFCHSRPVSQYGVNSSGNPGPGSRVKPGMTIGLAVIVFLAINLLSALFGADFYTSWWGNLERGMGVWGLAHFVAWFFMLVAVFKDKKDWQGLIGLSVAASVVVVATALIQRFGGLGGLLPATDRIYGVIGNAGILAGYLIFNIFLAGYLFFISSGKTKWFFALGGLLLAISLLLSGTRGAWLGLGAGIIVFLLLWLAKELYFLWKDGKNLTSQPPFKRGARGVKIPTIILLTVILFIGVLFLARDSALVKDNSILSRLTNVSLADSTIQSRLILWQSAWQAWQARPLLGFGPENFEAATGKYLSPRLAGFEAYGTDRSHNFIFDYGVTLGWLGLISYLVMIAAAGWLLVRNFCHYNFSSFVIPAKAGIQAQNSEPGSRVKPGMTGKKKENFFFSAIFLSLFAAYLIQNFFIFDSFVSYLMLFFVLALINFYSKKSICHPERSEGSILDSSATPQNDKKKNSHLEHIRSAQYKLREGSLNVVKKIGLVFFAIFIISALYLFNLKSILAAYRANQILSLPLENVAQAAPLLKDALSFNTFVSPEIAYQAALDYIIKINQQPALAQNEEFYNIAANELSKIIERSPNRARNYIALAWLDLYFSGQDSSRINEAINLGNKIKELSPNKKDAYLILVAGYALSGQADKAQEVISWALVIDGKMGEEVKAYWEKIR